MLTLYNVGSILNLKIRNISNGGTKMIKVVIPDSKDKIIKQIAALEWQIQQDTNSKDKTIHSQALKDLQERLLYISYLALQSNEFKENILSYESFKQEGHDIAIKVIFPSFWLRVYRTSRGIEWY